MKILGIDASGNVASIAILEDDVLIGEYTINYKKTHSQTLLPMLDQLAKAVELDMSSVDAIAVSAGPGSFTGLRIGSATAKGLAMALEKPIVEVSTLEGMAYQCVGVPGLVCPIMDARRSQTYTAAYDMSSGEASEVIAPMAVAIEELIEALNEKGERVTFLGDGVPVFKEVIEKTLKVSYTFAPAHRRQQSAAAVAMAAVRLLASGKTVSAAEHAPEYLRVSQAERERAEREGSNA